jgi:hypothetical protein
MPLLPRSDGGGVQQAHARIRLRCRHRCRTDARDPRASERCIALHASDLCVPLVALDAVVHVQGANGPLRMRNYAEVDPQTGLDWTSKALRDCYAVGAERFGWSRRQPEIGSMREGAWRVGYGMAGVTYAWWQMRCEARATIDRDGSAFARSAATDIGTGTYTVMKQLSAEGLGLELDQVRFDLGDSDMPWSPLAGGSGLTGALANAVHIASQALINRFLDTVADDTGSPLRGCALDDVAVNAGRIHRKTDTTMVEAYTEILARHDLDELTADGESAPPEPAGRTPAGAFAAKFVEVRVDADLGLLRVARIVSVIDGGRILNEKLAAARSSAAPLAASARRCSRRPSPMPGPDASRMRRSVITSSPSMPMCPTSMSCSSVGRTGSTRSAPRGSARSACVARRRDRERRLPRHRQTDPLAADHHRPTPLSHCRRGVITVRCIRCRSFPSGRSSAA